MPGLSGEEVQGAGAAKRTTCVDFIKCSQKRFTAVGDRIRSKFFAGDPKKHAGSPCRRLGGCSAASVAASVASAARAMIPLVRNCNVFMFFSGTLFTHGFLLRPPRRHQPGIAKTCLARLACACLFGGAHLTCQSLPCCSILCLGTGLLERLL